MDTPDNSRVKPSLSLLSTKFEESPVFNYISTLSPIKQFSVNNSAQSFHFLSFASPQPLETPSPIKCPQEPTVESANHDSDASMNSSSQDGTKSGNADVSKAVQPRDFHIEKSDKFSTGREVYVTNNEPSKLANVLPSVKHECARPESTVVCSGFPKPESELSVVGTEKLSAKVVQDDLREAETTPRVVQINTGVEDDKEVSEWEKFIYEACDMFDSQSPTQGTPSDDQPDENDDSGTLSFIREFLQTPTENVDNSQKIQSSGPCNSSENDGGARKPDETSQVCSLRARAVLAEEVVHHSKTDVDEKPTTQQQQTTRRRSLVYEVSGSHYRKLLSDTTSSSPISSMAASTNTSNEKCLVSSRLGSNKISSVLPGIGLHLNALAATGREKIIVKRESLTCRRQLISAPRTMSSFDSLNPDVESLNPPSGTEIVESFCEVPKDETYLNENASESSAFGEDVGLPPSSPKKKRKNQDNVGDADSCKRCNCKRSKCLKLYCECFAAGLYCVEPCNCQDCFNKPAHEDIVLETRRQIESRNPLAFAPKVVICSGTPNSMIMSNGSNPIRALLEKEKLNGSNFLDWYRNLRTILTGENRAYVLEKDLPKKPGPEVEEDEIYAWETHNDDNTNVSCLMLATMNSKLQKQYENMEKAYDMMVNLKAMFQEQARTERYNTVKAIFDHKMGNDDSVSAHVMKMIGYFDNLERLDAGIGKELSIDIVLQSLPLKYHDFITSYNLHDKKPSLIELHGMLKTAEASLNKGHTQTPSVLMVQKGNDFKKQGGGYKGKGKAKVANHKFEPKSAKKNQSEDVCNYCSEKGHWKRNCKKFLEDLKKGNVASTSELKKK